MFLIQTNTASTEHLVQPEKKMYYNDCFDMKLVNHVAMRFNMIQCAKFYQLLLSSFNPHCLHTDFTHITEGMVGQVQLPLRWEAVISMKQKREYCWITVQQTFVVLKCKSRAFSWHQVIHSLHIWTIPPTYSSAVGMVPLLDVMEGVQRLQVPLLDHSLEEADGVPLNAVPPLMEQTVLLACLYSL
jgi:hypothetical protein